VASLIVAALIVLRQAVFKALKTTSKGAGAAMKDIEIVAQSTGAPSVRLSGAAKEAADAQGVSSFQLSISHADGVAISVALAQK
jgi:fatty acid synthase subunit alpha